MPANKQHLLSVSSYYTQTCCSAAADSATQHQTSANKATQQGGVVLLQQPIDSSPTTTVWAHSKCNTASYSSCRPLAGSLLALSLSKGFMLSGACNANRCNAMVPTVGTPQHHTTPSKNRRQDCSKCSRNVAAAGTLLLVRKGTATTRS